MARGSSPGGISVEQIVQIARLVFALRPLAADIVEYNPLLDASGDALERLSPFLKEVAQWLG